MGLSRTFLIFYQNLLRTSINIHEKYIAREIELFASEHVEEELNKIPLNYRQQHLDMFGIFGLVPKLIVGGLTRLGPIGIPTANPKRRALNSLLLLLPNGDDAWHLLIASSNRTMTIPNIRL